jgi:hypothetical protein
VGVRANILPLISKLPKANGSFAENGRNIGERGVEKYF